MIPLLLAFQQQAQELQQGLQEMPEVVMEDPSVSLLSVIMKGGWIMIPIILASLIAIAIAVEKILVLRRNRINTNQFIMRLRGFILKDSIQDAINLCARTPGPTAKVLMKGLSKAGRSKRDMQEIIETAGREEIYTLEKHLGILASVAAVAPMIGFLGTVTGMIRAFMRVEQLGGNVNASVLAGGIWEALLTTAAGLFVGIPAYLIYNYLVSNVEKQVMEMEVSTSEIIDLVYSESDNEIQNRKEIAEGI